MLLFSLNETTIKILTRNIFFKYQKDKGGLWMQRSSDSSFFRGRGFQIQLNKPVQSYQRVVSSLFISFCVIFGIWTITVISFTVYHKVITVHEKKVISSSLERCLDDEEYESIRLCAFIENSL